MPELPTFSAGEALTAEKLNSIIVAIKELQQAGSVGQSQTDQSYEPIVTFDPLFFVSKITGVDGAGQLYTATEQVSISGDFDDFTDGDRNCSSTSDPSSYVDINGWQNVPNDTFVFSVEMQEDDSFRYWFVHVPPPPPTQDGTVPYVLTYSMTNQAYEWIAVPDTAKNYVFGWSTDDQDFTWLEEADCDDGSGSASDGAV